MKITIVSMLSGSFDPYWRDVELGIDGARKNFNTDVELLTPPKTHSTESQITSWQLSAMSEIARKRDTSAVAVAMLNHSRAADAISRVTSADIPVLTFDTDAPESTRSFFIGTNNYAAGSMSGYNLAKKINFSGDIVIDSPSLIVQSCLERIRGFKDVIARYNDIRIAREVTGGESIDAMKAQAEHTVSTVKNLKGMFCASGTSAIVNAEAIRRAGLEGSVKIVCFDAGRDIISLIRSGAIESTIAQRPYTMGFRIMDYLYQIGKLGIATVMKSIPPGHIVDTGVHNVTASSIDTYRESMKRLGIPVDF